MRARAMSTLGGTMRIGVFVGPFLGAALMHFMGLPGAYLIAIAMMLGTGVLSFLIPDIEPRQRSASTEPDAKPKMTRIARSHARVFLTLGMGILLVSALRAARQIDRKSTRLLQSLMRISYAVFCLKKKKKQQS